MLFHVVLSAEASSVSLTQGNWTKEFSTTMNGSLVTLEITRIGEVLHFAAQDDAFVRTFVLIHVSPTTVCKV